MLTHVAYGITKSQVDVDRNWKKFYFFGHVDLTEN